MAISHSLDNMGYIPYNDLRGLTGGKYADYKSFLWDYCDVSAGKGT